MAEVTNEGGGGKPKTGKPRQKKSSTKIDMTPMVDLAFLLLTFFMLTTAFNKPPVMEIKRPHDHAERPVNANDVFNVILAPRNKLYYYTGLDYQDAKEASFSPSSANYVRRIVTKARNENFKNRAGSDSSNFRFTVLIKPVDGSRYANLVDIFDEMNIANIHNYSLMDASPDDMKMIKNLEKNGGIK